jgi:hypothetical protein
MVATVAFGVGLALHWGSLPAAAVCVLLRFHPTFRSEQSGTGATFWLRAGCSASDQKAPPASGLLTLLARRSRRLPTDPKRIVWMIKRMIKQGRHSASRGGLSTGFSALRIRRQITWNG